MKRKLSLDGLVRVNNGRVGFQYARYQSVENKKSIFEDSTVKNYKRSVHRSAFRITAETEIDTLWSKDSACDKEKVLHKTNEKLQGGNKKENVRNKKIQKDEKDPYLKSYDEKLFETQRKNTIIKNRGYLPIKPIRKNPTIYRKKLKAQPLFLAPSSPVFFPEKPKHFQFLKNWRDISFVSKWQQLTPFVVATTWVFAIVSVGIFVFGGLGLKAHVLGVSDQEKEVISEAISDIQSADFESAAKKFASSGESFAELSKEFNRWSGLLRRANEHVPMVSLISSGSRAIDSASALAEAGEAMSQAATVISSVKEFSLNEESASFLDALEQCSLFVEKAHTALLEANEHIARISVNTLPETMHNEFLMLKSALPEAVRLSGWYVENTHVFADLLGANGPRKYLFLFQNTHEARATGGFIGSYGRLDIDRGHVDEFFVDNIFNPDGQLSENIVPPEPIRKISAAWSLHDSNWFLDFPTSAQKAMFFYEKGRGPTTDGVIAITPEVLRRMLEVTGPIAMPEYDTVIGAENFMQAIQYKVEEDFDKEENRPKKILSDLAPEILNRFFGNLHGKNALVALEIISDLLSEKHILLFARDEEIQTMIEHLGFSGAVAEVRHDYLAVVHSNINGFKTDGVIKENISHESEIQSDGTVINTVTIQREHTGGDTPYDWYNRVNSDYLRLYVPLGSTLLSVSGHTRETVRDPIDYSALGFSRDEDISAIESTMIRDEGTGTQIFEESGKTVFGNWVYVSPKERTTVTYRYALPFRVDISSEEPTSFSLLIQKQPGTIGRSYSYVLRYPQIRSVVWKSDSWNEQHPGGFSFSGDLNRDHFFGVVFGGEK